MRREKGEGRLIFYLDHNNMRIISLLVLAVFTAGEEALKLTVDALFPLPVDGERVFNGNFFQDCEMFVYNGIPYQKCWDEDAKQCTLISECVSQQ